MQTLLLAVEAAEDPIWLRTLATVLPFLGPIVVGLIAAPWLVQKVQHSRQPRTRTTQPESTPESTGPGLPAPVAIEAQQRAQEDPLLRLLIEDLHGRLSQAHREAVAAQQQRAADAAQIARLTAEVDDLEIRYQNALTDLGEARQDLRATRARLQEIHTELEQTRRRLQVCMEGYKRG